MNLTPREKDKLLVSMAAMVARGRLARGVRLNHPEAIALITDSVVEGARDGRSVADLMEAGAQVVTARAVHGGHPRDDPRRSGRGDLSGRDQARHRPPPDPMTATPRRAGTGLALAARPTPTSGARPAHPYVNHCCEVAPACRRGRGGDPTVIAALLHDVVEKTATTQVELGAGLGATVAGLVAAYRPAAMGGAAAGRG